MTPSVATQLFDECIDILVCQVVFGSHSILPNKVKLQEQTGETVD